MAKFDCLEDYHRYFTKMCGGKSSIVAMSRDITKTGVTVTTMTNYYTSNKRDILFEIAAKEHTLCVCWTLRINGVLFDSSVKLSNLFYTFDKELKNSLRDSNNRMFLTRSKSCEVLNNGK